MDVTLTLTTYGESYGEYGFYYVNSIDLTPYSTVSIDILVATLSTGNYSPATIMLFASKADSPLQYYGIVNIFSVTGSGKFGSQSRRIFSLNIDGLAGSYSLLSDKDITTGCNARVYIYNWWLDGYIN